MSSVPPTMAAEMALVKQDIALSVIKQSAEQEKALANIIEQASRSAPVSGSRGANVNLQA